jgi:hypothetical protein
MLELCAALLQLKLAQAEIGPADRPDMTVNPSVIVTEETLWSEHEATSHVMRAEAD